RNIARLYEIILASLSGDEPAQAVLNAFLAAAGQHAVILRELIYIFMQSDQGGSHDRLYFRAGLRTLARRGLLREHYAERPISLEPNAQLSAHKHELSMHTLTYRILRDLSGMKPFRLEAKYFNFIRASTRQPSDDDISFEARTYA